MSDTIEITENFVMRYSTGVREYISNVFPGFVRINIVIPLVVFAVLFAVDFLGSKPRHKAFRVFAVILTGYITARFFFLYSVTGSVAMSYLALAFVMTATVFIMRFIKLSVLDYAVMFSCFTCVTRFVGIKFSSFGIALPFLYVFIVVLVICKIRLKRLGGHLFYVWFAAVMTAIEAYGFNVLFNKYVHPLGYTRDSAIEKVFVWGIARVVFIAVNLAFICAIKRLFGKRFDEINQMGRAYPKIERFFIYNSIVILLLMIFLYVGYRLARSTEYYESSVPELFNLFSPLALVIQVSFLIMIFRITWLRDNLKSKTLENQSLTAYSSALEENMDGIRNIKHDIKNIFLTMGRFVEQSGDSEIQTFFREKISPFANEEIAKSDLYGKLAAIDNEQLKAFLFYKISQAVERGVGVDLDIAPQFSNAETRMAFADLVRILGILLDNAIEECMELAHGGMGVKISCNDDLISYVVKNTVSSERKANGIRPSVSSKGGGRGSGLAIVHGILEKYGCATLNSYFQEDCFVQNLVVYQTG